MSERTFAEPTHLASVNAQETEFSDTGRHTSRHFGPIASDSPPEQAENGILGHSDGRNHGYPHRHTPGREILDGKMQLG